jgi:hypothetical protein
MGGVRLSKPIVGMALDPATGGYWLVAADGGIFSFGAPFYGSTGAIHLNQPVVGMVSTPSGHGYWLVAADGGVFTFGDAKYYGSMGGTRLNQPVVGIAAASSGRGYWLVASDGGVFTFGDAPFLGSTGALRLNKPITSMASTGDGGGYWLVASDGGIFTFGDAPYLGSTGSYPGPAPIVSIATTENGFPFPPGSTGYDVSVYSCQNLPAARTFGIIEIAGALDGHPNTCFSGEAAWAGTNMSPYIFMNGLPNPAPPQAFSGPAGACSVSDTSCQSFNYGYFWAQHWVQYSHSLGFSPTLWWLDVETGATWGTTASNSQVITGAIQGLRASGVVPGIYSTSYQWPRIAGSLQFPNIILWAAGAGTLNGGDGYPSATSFCSDPTKAFAGGIIKVVQYGWDPQQASPYYDPDYACT